MLTKDPLDRETRVPKVTKVRDEQRKGTGRKAGKKSSSGSITFEAKVDSEANEPILGALTNLNEFFSRLVRTLFVARHVRQEEPNALKMRFLQEFGISGRMYNSACNHLDAVIRSQAELRNREVKRLSGRQQALEKKVRVTKKKVSALKKLGQGIRDYRKKVHIYRSQRKTSELESRPPMTQKRGKRSTPIIKKKPRQPKAIQGKSLDAVVKDEKEAREMIHQKSRALAIVGHKLEKCRSTITPRVCFGSRKRFHAQHHLEANGYSSHEEWRAAWREARDSQSYWIGSKAETAGNLNAQYNPLQKTLQLRVPYALEPEFGEYITIRNLDFGPFQDQVARAASGSKGKEPVTFRLIARRNQRGNRQLYVQASIAPEKAELKTDRAIGIIGVDVNSDHLAICETDRFGNPVHAFSLCYDLADKTTEQTKAILGDYCALVNTYALKVGKPVAIEKLNFEQKKQALKEEGNKSYRRMLSSFAYNRFSDLMHSQTRRMGVGFYRENPAYSSVIGFYKFAGYTSLTSHEKAALVLARRAAGFSERFKPHGTRTGAASIQNPLAGSHRHVWSTWNRVRAKVREQMRLDGKPISGHLVTPRRPSGCAASIRHSCDSGDPRWDPLEKSIGNLHDQARFHRLVVGDLQGVRAAWAPGYSTCDDKIVQA